MWVCAKPQTMSRAVINNSCRLIITAVCLCVCVSVGTTEEGWRKSEKEGRELMFGEFDFVSGHPAVVGLFKPWVRFLLLFYNKSGSSHCPVFGSSPLQLSVCVWLSQLSAWLVWSGSLRFSCARFWSSQSGSEVMAGTQAVLVGLAVCSVEEYSLGCLKTLATAVFSGGHVKSTCLMLNTMRLVCRCYLNTDHLTSTMLWRLLSYTSYWWNYSRDKFFFCGSCSHWKQETLELY